MLSLKSLRKYGISRVNIPPPYCFSFISWKSGKNFVYCRTKILKYAQTKKYVKKRPANLRKIIRHLFVCCHCMTLTICIGKCART